VVSNGRRLRAVLVDIRATACRPATLKHAIVLRTMRTRGLIVVVNDFFHVRKSKKSLRFSPGIILSHAGVAPALWTMTSLFSTTTPVRR